jgi:hypothetical protein
MRLCRSTSLQSFLLLSLFHPYSAAIVSSRASRSFPISLFSTRTQRTDGGPSFNCCRYTSLYCTTHHTAREVKVLDVHSSQTIPLHSSREGFGVRIPFALPRLRVCGDEHGSHEHPLDFFPYDKPTVSLSEVLPPFKPRLPASKWQHERPNHRYPATDCRQSHAVALLSHRIEQ